MKNICIIGFILIMQNIYCQTSDLIGWRMQGNNKFRNGYTSNLGPIAPELNWIYDFGTTFQDNASPVVCPNGTIIQGNYGEFYKLKF